MNDEKIRVDIDILSGSAESAAVTVPQNANVSLDNMYKICRAQNGRISI